MKRFGVIFVWAMAAVLLIAVSITAVSDRLALVPLTTQTLVTTITEPAAFTVNLNTATADELQQLEGVGQVLSARIIAYREANGSFTCIEDLLDIEGIGQTRLEKWRPYLTV